MRALSLLLAAPLLTSLPANAHGVDDNDRLYPCAPIDAPTFLTTAAQAGWRSAEYNYNVYATDTEVGRILETLDVLGRTDDTPVNVTTDHGGEGKRHGVTLKGVGVADMAVTVLWALGLPLPENALGRPRLDAFELAPAVAPVAARSSEGTG